MTLSAESELKQRIGATLLPQIGHSVAAVGKVLNATVDGRKATVEIELGFPASGLHADIVKAVKAVAEDALEIDAAEVSISTRIAAHGVQRNLKPLANVRNVIAIASGKGGVGKSTTAVNLALALLADGAKVGILDADIYGPSIPLMLGVPGQRPTSEDGQSMQPLAAHGLQVMSIGFLIDADQPMIWRGPMVTQALNQMLQQTQWSDLDYLVVDMPPGTGDIQLTLSQSVPVSGAVIVDRKSVV